MRFALLFSILLFACCGAQAQQATTLIAVPAPPAAHDGAHDFDSVLGNFTFRLRRMQHPLTSNPDWMDMAGTGACYKVWGGRAQLDTVELDSADGSHIEGLTSVSTTGRRASGGFTGPTAASVDSTLLRSESSGTVMAISTPRIRLTGRRPLFALTGRA